MFYCTMYGIKVKSDFYISDGIQIEPTEKVDVYIELGKVPEFVHESKNNGNVGEFRDSFYWAFVEGVAFFYLEGGNHIVIEEVPGDTGCTVATFLSGLVFALLFTQRGFVPLHGSFLDYKGKGCLITGYSGSGKSSTAFELIKHGAVFVADDVAMVDSETMMVNPGFPIQRLCADQVERLGFDKDKLIYLGERKDKYARRLSEEEYIYEKRPFDAIFRIKAYDGDELVFNEIEGSEKLKIVVENVFCYFFISFMKMKPEHMKRYIKIASNVKVYSIMRPRNKNTLDDITNYIFSRLEELRLLQSC